MDTGRINVSGLFEGKLKITQFKTEQEQFWAGTFGNEYIDRNKDIHYISSNIALFAKILDKTKQVQSIIEFGANIGLNLIAIKQLLPKVEISAVEINQKAVAELKKLIKGATVYNQSILDLPSWEGKIHASVDLALIKGVLIHINPEKLQSVYEVLYDTSKRYICIVEYYNPTPVSVSYRGHQKSII